MINTKLKEIRIYLGFSETTLSRYFNMSSYKYKGCEDGSAEITTEMLALLSVMFCIPLDCLISEEFSLRDIFDLPSIKKLKDLSAEEKQRIAEKNLCARCTVNCKKVTYTTVKNIKLRLQEIFIKNVCELLAQKSVESFEILKVLKLKSLVYDKYTPLPDPMAVAEAARLLDTSIQSLFDEKKMQA